MNLECFGKALSVVGVVLLALAISPTGDFVDPSDCWLRRQTKWIIRFFKESGYSSPVTINPILLYSGLILGIVGIIIS